MHNVRLIAINGLRRAGFVSAEKPVPTSSKIFFGKNGSDDGGSFFLPLNFLDRK